MNPDWYVDPLGRFEGRYWDGESWTERVKDRGRLVIDPDWPPQMPGQPTEERAEAASGGDSHDDDLDRRRRLAAATSDAPDGDAGPSSAGEADSIGDGSEPDQAVAELADVDRTERHDFEAESPTRRVAVLGELAEDSLESGSDAHPLDELAGPLDPQSEPDGRRRAALLLGAAVVVIGLLLVVVPRLFGDDESTDEQVVSSSDEGSDAGPVVPSQDDDVDDGVLPATAVDPEDEVADPEAPDDGEGADSGEASDGVTEAAADDAAPAPLPGDALPIGALAIADGRLVLGELAEWHRSSLVGRGIVLGEDAGCWFGRLGQAVVQVVHCGPVSTADAPEPTFDFVPLDFEDISDGVVQVRALTDAVLAGEVLSNGLELIGPEGTVVLPDDLAPAVSTRSSDGAAEQDAGGTTEAGGDTGYADAVGADRGERSEGE